MSNPQTTEPEGLVRQAEKRFNHWFSRQRKWAIKKTLEARAPQKEPMKKPSGFLDEKLLVRRILEK